jgi:hypothetical protein
VDTLSFALPLAILDLSSFLCTFRSTYKKVGCAARTSQGPLKLAYELIMGCAVAAYIAPVVAKASVVILTGCMLRHPRLL